MSLLRSEPSLAIAHFCAINEEQKKFLEQMKRDRAEVALVCPQKAAFSSIVASTGGGH
jgi:hypothetical protein